MSRRCILCCPGLFFPESQSQVENVPELSTLQDLSDTFFFFNPGGSKDIMHGIRTH